MFKRNDDETSVWISNTDLMSGLTVIFLLIAIAITGQYQSAKKEITKNEASEKQIVATINAAFSKTEIEEFQLNANGVGSIYFPDYYGTFDVGSSDLSPLFKEKLNLLMPKYIETLYKEKDFVDEIRIEGHTSSEWHNLPPEVAYFHNMKLSQDRTRAILEYLFTIPELKGYHDFMREKITANGLSSKNTIKIKGTDIEDKKASRRIEFKVVTNSQKIVNLLKEKKK